MRVYSQLYTGIAPLCPTNANIRLYIPHLQVMEWISVVSCLDHLLALSGFTLVLIGALG